MEQLYRERWFKLQKIINSSCTTCSNMAKYKPKQQNGTHNHSLSINSERTSHTGIHNIRSYKVAIDQIYSTQYLILWVTFYRPQVKIIAKENNTELKRSFNPQCLARHRRSLYKTLGIPIVRSGCGLERSPNGQVHPIPPFWSSATIADDVNSFK